MPAADRAKPSPKLVVIAALAVLAWTTPLAARPPRQVVGMETPALRKAAEKGDAAAQLELARRLLFGRRAAVEPKAAVEILQKLAASESPASAAAMYELSVCYRLGSGVPVDDARGEQLLKKSAEAKHPAAIVELWERSLASEPATSPSTRPTTGPATGPLAEIVKLARDGEASAQLALARAINRKQVSAAQAGEDALGYMLKATTGEDRVALAAIRLILEGDGPIRGDRPRAITLYRRLAEEGPREAMERLAELSPESFAGLARPIALEKLRRDDGRAIGDAVEVSGPVVAADTDENGVTMSLQVGPSSDDTVRVLASASGPREAAANAKVGRVARVAGVVSAPGEVRGLVVQIPEPKYVFQFRVQPPQVIRGRTRKYMIEGVFHNTSSQQVTKATLRLRLYQPETPNDQTETITLENLSPGEKRTFVQDFNFEDFRDRGVTTEPIGEVKVEKIDW